MICGQTPLVSVSRMVMVTLVPLQASATTGVSKLQLEPQSTVLSLAQVNTGGVVLVLTSPSTRKATLVEKLFPLQGSAGIPDSLSCQNRTGEPLELRNHW